MNQQASSSSLRQRRPEISRLQNISLHHHAGHHAKVAARSLTKEVDELTPEEKMSIFIVAGVPTEYRNGKLETVSKVGLQKVNGRWCVGVSGNGMGRGSE